MARSFDRFLYDALAGPPDSIPAALLAGLDTFTSMRALVVAELAPYAGVPEVRRRLREELDFSGAGQADVHATAIHILLGSSTDADESTELVRHALATWHPSEKGTVLTVAAERQVPGVDEAMWAWLRREVSPVKRRGAIPSPVGMAISYLVMQDIGNASRASRLLDGKVDRMEAGNADWLFAYWPDWSTGAVSAEQVERMRTWVATPRLWML